MSLSDIELELKQQHYRLERWKVFVSILTPLTLAALTYVVNKAIEEQRAVLNREAQILEEKQKIYAELGQKLNVIYVYIKDVGDYARYEPPKIIELKRQVDRQFHMYCPYWSDQTEQAYRAFLDTSFETFTAYATDAKINSGFDQKKLAAERFGIAWNNRWDILFTGTTPSGLEENYFTLVASLLKDTVSARIRQVAPKREGCRLADD